MTNRPDHQLLYLVDGRDTFYREARFSIVSALLRSRDADALNIVVHCQHPERFTDLPVATVQVTEDELQQWAGAIGYKHRAKPCLLRQSLAHAEKTVLIDTDTFFLQPPESLFAQVEPDHLLVDEILEPWRKADDGAFYRGVSPHLGDQCPDDAMPLINSGIIGVTADHEQLLDETIALIDRLYHPAGCFFTTEQLALGICAWGRYRFRAQGSIVKHYWSRKRLIRAKADAFLVLHHGDLLGQQARSDLPLVTPEHPKPGALTRLWYKFRLSRFPARYRQLLLELCYGCHHYGNRFDRACREAWWEKAVANWKERSGGDDDALQQLLASDMVRSALGDDYPAFKAFVDQDAMRGLLAKPN